MAKKKLGKKDLKKTRGGATVSGSGTYTGSTTTTPSTGGTIRR